MREDRKLFADFVRVILIRPLSCRVGAFAMGSVAGGGSNCLGVFTKRRILPALSLFKRAGPIWAGFAATRLVRARCLRRGAAILPASFRGRQDACPTESRMTRRFWLQCLAWSFGWLQWASFKQQLQADEQ